MTVLQIWDKTQGIVILKGVGEVNSKIALEHKNDEVTKITVTKYTEPEWNIELPCIVIEI